MGRALKALQHGWNIFSNPREVGFAQGPATSSRSGRPQTLRHYSTKSIVGSIYNRLAIDFAMVEFYHARLNEDGVPIDVIPSSLNDCLTLDPNIDQTAFMMKRDLAWTLFENGDAAIVPTDADLDPSKTNSYEIRDMRIGRVVSWRPQSVDVEVYDDREYDAEGKPVNGGVWKQVHMEKRHVALVENPFFDVMNAPSSNLQRLQRKLALLDGMDEAAGSGKLDMIIQLPYTVRGNSRAKQAEERRESMRQQLKDDELGIGYIDINEKVIQLNRPVDNKLLEQINTLYDAVFGELGLTPEIMNGTASQDAVNNYYDRTIEPIATAVAQEEKRKFLTKTARTQRQSIEIYRDPLKLIPTSELAEIVDKVTRSAVASANDIRPKIGLRPSKDPAANKLQNPNMPVEDQIPPAETRSEEVNNE